MKQRMMLCFVLLLCGWLTASAQLQEQIVKVNVVPDNADWKYQLGEKVKFTVSVTKNRIPLKDVKVWYEVSRDMMPATVRDTLMLEKGTLTIDAGTLKEAGFLRCRVWTRYDKRLVEGRATAAFAPEQLKPTTLEPEDFDRFWGQAVQANRRLPMDTRLRLLPERCTEKVNVYEWSIQNFRPGSRIYGILCVPTKPGKYPALLQVPGAGVRGYRGNVADAEKGMITLQIGIHGIPVTMDASYYTALGTSGLYRYQYQNWDNRDEVYYKRVYMGCLRAVDYLCGMPQYDGKQLIVHGGSQGGALSIVTAALHEKVTGVVSFFPALSELSGHLNNRAGGWPHLFMRTKESAEILKVKQKVTAYYDVVNFARRVKAPVFFYLGYNDMVCAPTSTYTAYNVLSQPKELLIMEEAEHYAYPEHWQKAMEWVYNRMNIHD